jgi:hypothetical protein
MNDTLSAAVIGAIAGYLIARHWPEIGTVKTLLHRARARLSAAVNI